MEGREGKWKVRSAEEEIEHNGMVCELPSLVGCPVSVFTLFHELQVPWTAVLCGTVHRGHALQVTGS